MTYRSSSDTGIIRFVTAILIAAFVSGGCSGRTFNVLDSGAVADGDGAGASDRDRISANTAAFQEAIDMASRNRGRVVVPEGTFTCGAIYLKSNMEFHLDKGAVLKASPDSSDYSPADVCPQSHPSKADKASGRHFVLCLGENNVRISGPGKIDGNSPAFTVAPGGGSYMAKKDIPWRPSQMLFFVGCTNVRLKDLELADSPYWNCFFYGCDNVKVEGLDIHSRRKPVSYNGDGLDIDCCRNVSISDCKINTSDDCIAIRADGRYLDGREDCSNVQVKNCSLSSLTSAIRLGVGSGTISDVRCSGISVEDTRSVFTIVSGWSRKTRGVNVKDAVFRDFKIRSSVQLFLIYPKVADHDRTVENITFEDIDAEVELPGLLYGYEDAPYRNFTFRNVKCNRGLDIRFAENVRIEGGGLEVLSLSDDERDEVWSRYERRKLEVRYNGFSLLPPSERTESF